MRSSLAVLFFAACASPNTPVAPDLSGVVVNNDLSTRDATTVDLARGDGPVACTLGDPDHCGSCITVCPPGMDTAGTKRTCSMPTAFGTCDYLCSGEFYEIDGKASNGCEAEDLPIQDTTITAVAVALPNSYTPTADLGASGNPSNIISQVYGDSRQHDVAPTSRPNGREDWYKLTVTGGGATDRGMTACLGITNFPTDDVFELCLSGKGAATFIPAGCKQVNPMSASTERCIQQAMAADESGLYYARVRRISGTWTAMQYALYLEH